VTRVLLFTGKGGVGKTTVSAATATRTAERGLRTLVLSTDPAHSLADALDAELGDQPSPITERLWGQQLDTRHRLEEHWGELRGYLGSILDRAGVRSIEAEELTVLPGLDDVLALTDLVDLVRSDEWDIIVVDCAPTAETMRLLSLPQILSWWMERLFPVGKQMAATFGPSISQMINIPVPGDEVFDALERLYHRLGAARDVLADNEVTSLRLVVNPEKVVVSEARRTATYLALFGFGLDAVVVNRLLPDDITDAWFDRWKAAQAEQLDEVRAGFEPLPVLTVPLAPEEPVGLERLAELAAALYGETEEATRLFEGDVMHIEPEAEGWRLVLELPFAEKGDVKLVRRGTDLVVSIGPYRRSLALPEALARRKVVDAAMTPGRLTVTFA
jgi:arsenite/tail-anchored protein-transporting ATPase